MNLPELGIKDSNIPKQGKEKFDTYLFLPPGEGRQGEGGLRTRGYFKFSYEIEDGRWYACDWRGRRLFEVDTPEEFKIEDGVIKLPLITAITVVLNGKEYLEKTIQSVINQTYPNVEYIIVDGGSTDGTIDIIKKYENYIDYWVSEPDKGIYDAMNKGIAMASGKYLIFMNAGDRFANENTLLKVKKEVEKNNYPDFIYGDAIEENSQGNLFLKKAYSHKYIWYGMFTHHQAMFYKSKIIHENKIRYRLKYKIAADYAFTYEFLKHAGNILKVCFSICVFLRGGLSTIAYKEGLYEANLVRKEIGNLSSFRVSVIDKMHRLKHFLKYEFEELYSLLRYKRFY